MNGVEVRWCHACGEWHRGDVCEKCGCTDPVLRCYRCGHEWRPRKQSPGRCPACNSPYWGRTRVRSDRR